MISAKCSKLRVFFGVLSFDWPFRAWRCHTYRGGAKSLSPREPSVTFRAKARDRLHGGGLRSVIEIDIAENPENREKKWKSGLESRLQLPFSDGTDP